MFADDVGLLSNTVKSLQRQLPLHQCCLERKLSVNSYKTKTVVFKNGGYVSSTESGSTMENQ